jgi:hypothetical protein
MYALPPACSRAAADAAREQAATSGFRRRARSARVVRCADCKAPAILVLIAFFRPRECPMATAAWLPRAVGPPRATLIPFTVLLGGTEVSLLSLAPARRGVGKRRGQRRADRPENRGQPRPTKRRCRAVVGRLLDPFDKDVNGVSSLQHSAEHIPPVPRYNEAPREAPPMIPGPSADRPSAEVRFAPTMLTSPFTFRR